MTKQYTHIDENGDTRENFCGACLSIPLSLVGVGVAGMSRKGHHKKTKKIMLWGGLTLTLVSIIITIIYLSKCKNCQ